MKTVQFKTNVGTNDYSALGLDFEKTYKDGDVCSLEDAAADKCIAAGVAREWDEEAKAEAAAKAKAQHEADIQAAMPEAVRAAAVEKAKAEAADRAAKLPATPATITSHGDETGRSKKHQ